MLVDNADEVTEPYVFEFINSLTQGPDTIVHKQSINTSSAMSTYLKAYVEKQLNNPASEEIVAEDEPPENSATTDASAHLTDGG